LHYSNIITETHHTLCIYATIWKVVYYVNHGMSGIGVFGRHSQAEWNRFRAQERQGVSAYIFYVLIYWVDHGWLGRKENWEYGDGFVMAMDMKDEETDTIINTYSYSYPFSLSCLWRTKPESISKGWICRFSLPVPVHSHVCCSCTLTATSAWHPHACAIPSRLRLSTS